MAPGCTHSVEAIAARIAGTAEGTPEGAQDAAGCTGAAMVGTQQRDHQSSGPPQRPLRGSDIGSQWAHRNRAGRQAGQYEASPQGWAGPDHRRPNRSRKPNPLPPHPRAVVGAWEERRVELLCVGRPGCSQISSGSQRKSPAPTPPLCCQTRPLVVTPRTPPEALSNAVRVRGLLSSGMTSKKGRKWTTKLRHIPSSGRTLVLQPSALS